MKTIDPTLLAMQKNPNAALIARASLADNSRLHLVRSATGTSTGGRTNGANCGTFFVRIRYTGSGLDTLEYQKITDPTDDAQWNAWTLLASNVAYSRSIAVFWTGTYCVIVWQDSATLDVKFVRATDGQSWSAAATAWTTADFVDAYGISGGSSQSGLALSYNYQLYWCSYDPGANTFGAHSSAGLATTSQNFHVAGFYDAANSRHVFGLCPNGYLAGSRFGLAFLTRSTAGAWGAGRVFLTSDTQGISSLAASQSQINGLWWFSLYRRKSWGQETHWLTCSDDGLAWEDPLYTDAVDSPVLEILGSLPGYAGAWLATERDVYQAETYSYWSNQTVVRYQFTSGDGDTRVYGGRGAHLTVVVDNRAGSLAEPRLNSVLTLERGYSIAGTDYYVSAGTYHVIGYRYLLDDHLLELHAIDAIGRLSTWVADTAIAYRSETVQALVELVCARAGVHTVSFDASALWSETVDRYTHPAGENARLSLHSLNERVPFDYVVQEDGSLHFYVPALSPAAQHTYGRASGEHTFWPGEFGAHQATTYTLVVGAPPRTVGAEAGDTNAIYAAGRRHTELVNDRRVKSAADAEALAEARLVALQERQRAGVFEAPPNFALELGDVLAFSGSLWAAGYTWRVQQIVEQFNMGQRARRFLQRIHLRGTA